MPGWAAVAGIVPSVKMFPNSSTVKLTTQKLGPNVSISVKTALFTVIIIIKSAPSTATRSKIARVFGDRTGILLQWYGGGKKKSKKNSKKFKKTWRPNIRVFTCKPGSVLRYLITLLCTALDSMLWWRPLALYYVLRGCNCTQYTHCTQMHTLKRKWLIGKFDSRLTIWIFKGFFLTLVSWKIVFNCYLGVINCH